MGPSGVARLFGDGKAGCESLGYGKNLANLSHDGCIVKTLSALNLEG